MSDDTSSLKTQVQEQQRQLQAKDEQIAQLKKQLEAAQQAK